LQQRLGDREDAFAAKDLAVAQPQRILKSVSSN